MRACRALPFALAIACRVRCTTAVHAYVHVCACTRVCVVCDIYMRCWAGKYSVTILHVRQRFASVRVCFMVVRAGAL